MKKRYGILTLGLAVLLTMGCGSADKGAAAYDTAAATGEYGYMEDSKAETEAPAEAQEAMPEMEETAVMEGLSSANGSENVQATGRKLIKTVNLVMETKEFDTLLESLRQQVEDIGGYIENSSVQGNSYYNRSGNRYAWLTLRIPSHKLDGFVTIVGEMGNVISRNESVEDITLQYVDVESHKEALETEQERLMALLEQAESMEDIITIESRLSEVRYQLQSYGSTLRTYDNKVEYSTVSIDVNEVERESTVLEEKSFIEEVRYRLSDNFYAIGQGLRNFAIWFLSSLPYLLIWAVIIFVIIKIVRKLLWKKPLLGKRKKKENSEEK